MENTIKANPIKIFTCGVVKAAIWAGSEVVNNAIVEVHSIKIDKSYKHRDSGERKYTNTFNAEDLPKVAVLAMEIYKFIRVETSDNNNLSEQNGIQNKRS